MNDRRQERHHSNRFRNHSDARFCPEWLDDLVAPSYLNGVLGSQEALMDVPSAPGVDGPQPESMNNMRGVCRTPLRARHTL